MSKPAKTYPDQLAVLKSRGLSIPDETFARHCLEHHNYYHAPGAPPGREGKIYNSLVLLAHLIQIIEPTNDWPKRLAALIQILDARLIPNMGFLPDWQQRPFWKQLLATP